MKVVVDKPLTGWKGLREGELLKKYGSIIKVGVDPELRQRTSDKDIASYCLKCNCDLITPDISAYTHFFEKGTETIQIAKYGYNEEADQVVYLIRVVDK